ncbi:hypothetical protein HMI48_05200 [Acidithiobacillus ferrooxidans]|uniref:hypothetical protein n=1 Tax=Acidithiobacillus ferrooxidans TaxID=920 RepID=UPI001C077A4F|nr:hypothetical protein [Acidithiobacillus ferrooxidans]MBU2773322.1 hypothetical protein [Acidithiobacillus ferrooxidans]
MASPLEVKVQINYWRGLTRRNCPDPRLHPGIVDELQVALRDALCLIHSLQTPQRPSLRWREEWIGKC